MSTAAGTRGRFGRVGEDRGGPNWGGGEVVSPLMEKRGDMVKREKLGE